MKEKERWGERERQRYRETKRYEQRDNETREAEIFRVYAKCKLIKTECRTERTRNKDRERQIERQNVINLKVENLKGEPSSKSSIVGFRKNL